MTVERLIKKLSEFPNNMPVATFNDISWKSKDDPEWIQVTKCTWEHTNYPYDQPNFDYVNLC